MQEEAPSESAAVAEVEFDLGVEDIYEVHRHVHGARLKRSRVRALLVALGVAVCTPAAVVNMPNDLRWMIGIVGALVFVICLAVWRGTRVRKDLVKTLCANRPRILGWRWLAIRDDGLVSRCAWSTTVWYWQAVLRVETSETLVVIYVDNSQMIPIPVRVFAGEAELSGFVEAVRRRIVREEDAPLARDKRA